MGLGVSGRLAARAYRASSSCCRGHRSQHLSHRIGDMPVDRAVFDGVVQQVGCHHEALSDSQPVDEPSVLDDAQQILEPAVRIEGRRCRGRGTRRRCAPPAGRDRLGSPVPHLVKQMAGVDVYRGVSRRRALSPEPPTGWPRGRSRSPQACSARPSWGLLSCRVLTATSNMSASTSNVPKV